MTILFYYIDEYVEIRNIQILLVVSSFEKRI